MISAVSNSAVLSARFALNRNQAAQNGVLQRLATGKKINSGKDGPAALICAERLAAEIKALEAESESLRRMDANAAIADGRTQQLSSLMSDLNGLVVASANQAGMSDAEIAANQLQIDSIVSSIQRITGESVSSLEGIDLPDGGNAELEGLLNGAAAAVASLASGGANSLSSGNFEAAQQAIKGAIQDVATVRGTIGAYQKNTLEPRLNSNQVAIENLMDSKSRISDTDFALETSNLSRLNVLTATSAKVLKIAQQQSERVLSLLA